MNRKQLEERAWKKTPRDERRSQKERYDWRSKTSTTERLTGNNRELLVFDPSGDTPGTMSPWVPLWSLYSDELRQRSEEGQQPKLRPPYHRTRPDYTGDVESGVSAERHATRKAPSQLDREIAHFLSGRTISGGAAGEDLEKAGHWQQRRSSYQRATPRQVIAKLGADHVAWLLGLPHPASAARSRARGEWDANNLELMSAYDRLADLIDQGRIK